MPKRVALCTVYYTRIIVDTARGTIPVCPDSALLETALVHRAFLHRAWYLHTPIALVLYTAADMVRAVGVLPFSAHALNQLPQLAARTP
jgi:hypothetical protein